MPQPHLEYPVSSLCIQLLLYSFKVWFLLCFLQRAFPRWSTPPAPPASRHWICPRGPLCLSITVSSYVCITSIARVQLVPCCPFKSQPFKYRSFCNKGPELRASPRQGGSWLVSWFDRAELRVSVCLCDYTKPVGEQGLSLYLQPCSWVGNYTCRQTTTTQHGTGYL